MAVDHPVLPVGADLQLKGGDIVGLLRLLGDGPLCGNASQYLEEMEVHLTETERQRRISDIETGEERRRDGGRE